jgi:hypothetical protein
MFNKRLLVILCWALQIMIIAKTVFELVMFVWGVVAGTPPIGIFQQGIAYGSLLSILLLLQDLGSNVFIYVIVAVLKGLVEWVHGKKK